MLVIAIVALIFAVIAIGITIVVLIGAMRHDELLDKAITSWHQHIEDNYLHHMTNSSGNLSSGATSEAIRRLEARVLKLEEVPPLTRALTRSEPVHSRDRITQVDE